MIQFKDGKEVIIKGEEEDRLLNELFKHKDPPADIIRTCPICGREYKGFPAVSRKDLKLEICPECGLLEALEAAGVSDEDKAEALEAARIARKGAGL